MLAHIVPACTRSRKSACQQAHTRIVCGLPARDTRLLEQRNLPALHAMLLANLPGSTCSHKSCSAAIARGKGMGQRKLLALHAEPEWQGGKICQSAHARPSCACRPGKSPAQPARSACRLTGGGQHMLRRPSFVSNYSIIWRKRQSQYLWKRVENIFYY